MDGDTLDVGSVVALKECKTAIKVAKGVMTHSTHSLLAGAGATEFARMLGYTIESLETDASENQYNNWVNNNCQPNYFRNFVDQSGFLRQRLAQLCDRVTLTVAGLPMVLKG